ncbi:MAG: hypothetical protein WBY93_16410, partial [Candidatus Binatus sp.]
VILSAAKNPGSFSAQITAPSTMDRPLRNSGVLAFCVIPSVAEGPRIFLDANRRTLNHGSNVHARLRRIQSSSASRALSEVGVFCAEKDPGFFAALRMTEEATARRFLINAGYAEGLRGER